MSTVYVKTDKMNRLMAIQSSDHLRDEKGWTAIDQGEGERYRYAQTQYLPDAIADDRGVLRYKLVDGKPVERMQEEMDADYAARPAPEPTTEELLLETAADHEYRICLMELGVSENDL